ncbi:MAG: hypothetical protein M1827_002838 [Pycnora praestabilis]|nr:MAG: hypothetical protein M1827_002838 [Pycnora praestabilis]
MYATSLQPSPFQYSCQNISPLSTTHPNVHFKSLFSSSPIPPQIDRKTDIPRSKRPSKDNPLLKHKDCGKQRRRELFLRKVRQGGEDRRWEAWEQQILRMEFLLQSKHWEAEQARWAEDSSMLYEEGDANTFPSLNDSDDAIREVEHVLQQENQQLDALLSLMSAKDDGSGDEDRASYCGSDDEEYDGLFMELTSRTSKAETRVQDSRQQEQGMDEDMDTSNG